MLYFHVNRQYFPFLLFYLFFQTLTHILFQSQSPLKIQGNATSIETFVFHAEADARYVIALCHVILYIVALCTSGLDWDPSKTGIPAGNWRFYPGIFMSTSDVLVQYNLLNRVH